MIKSDLKPQTQVLICNSQEESLRLNYVTYRIDNDRKVVSSAFVNKIVKKYGKLLVNIRH